MFIAEEGEDMLIVKLGKLSSTDSSGEPDLLAGQKVVKLLEAEEVIIYVLRPEKLVEVHGWNGTKDFSYYISKDGKRPEGFASDIEFWREAYIENSNGATTHVVRF